MATSVKLGEMPSSYPDVEQYVKRINFSLIASGKVDVSKAVLLSTCGQQAFALIETLIAPLDITSDDVTYAIICAAIIAHLKPKRILHYERHKLHSMVQQDDTVTHYVQRLKEQANQCDFGDLREGLVLSHFIFGLTSQEARSKLLSLPDLKLDDAVQLALLHESVTSASRTTEVSISATSFKSQPTTSSSPKFNNNFSSCFSCGGKHRRSDCKFRRATCRCCGKIGHISSICRQSATFSTNVLSQNESDSVIFTVSSNNNNNDNLWWESCQIGNSSVRFLVDTGSQVTVLPYSLATQTGLIIAPAPRQSLHAFGGGQVNLLGMINNAVISFRNNNYTGDILVAENHTKPILGMDALPSLHLVKVCSPLLCSNSRFIASFRLLHDASTDGMRYPARSLPFSMKAMVEVELKRLLAEGIIYRVENPIVSAPIVPVVKQIGAVRPIRICGDYSQTLNRLIDRDSYTLPRIEELLEKVAGATMYSVLDLQDAYLQVQLAEESQKLTSISTHLGHFAFTKLQFGISAAPLIFQEAMDKVLENIPYVCAYQDDILIGAPTKEIHDSTLRVVKNRLAAHNFVVNKSKCQEGQAQVKFLGYILRDGKLLPDPVRLTTFSQIVEPSNKEQLRSLLGTLRHYGCFCPNFSCIAKPLYQLLKNDVRWSWNATHSKAVSTLLSLISSGSITCYDQTKPLYLTSDASKDGLGYVLSHDADQKKIIWAGSRVLSAAEFNYSNIEREALAIVEATKYFHRFIAGRKFVIITDHAPLKYIFNTSTVSDRVSARLQRWAITLRAYDYEIQHTKGENMFWADTLSRLPQAHVKSKVPEVNMLDVNSLDELANGDSLLQDISQQQDAEIIHLKEYITNGWPKYIPRNMQPYAKSRDEYTIQSGLVFHGTRIVPSRQHRSRILRTLHENHPGIVRMIRLARQYFWWPGIDLAINAFVQRCFTCQTNARKRTNAAFSSWPEVTEFFERVHCDVAHYQGKLYLVLVDAFSKWVDVHVLNDLTSHSAIAVLRSTFKYVGLAANLVTDNASCFTSQEFISFLQNNFINHVKSPPGHHQSNGQAERVIAEFKLFLSKSSVSNSTCVSELHRRTIAFCLQHNTTPSSCGSIPNSFVFQKCLRTRLSVQCTVKNLPIKHLPVYVRVEHHKPAHSELQAQIGSNTFLDHRNRLVHESDVTARPPATDEVVEAPTHVTDTPAVAEQPILRRSTRERQTIQRYGIDEH